ncbi:MAG: hypothetical protein E6R03_07555 [Hyphomicrobiaceae bacterium]|nr:MAG: hypothetical protein E6R03_07555 [Hyphomicrobiaceae bacterium]
MVTNAIITADCACTICCGPNAKGIAANGRPPVEGKTVAGPRSIPLGTKVRIAGHIYTVTDRTARRFDGRWDIFIADHRRALKFGRRTNNVEIIK